MSTKDDFLRVPKLLPNGSNWISVRDRFRWAADARGLLKHIDGGITEPTPPTPSVTTSTAAATPAPDATTDAATLAAQEMAERGFELIHNRWCNNEATIKQAIANAVPDSVFNRIKSKTTAKEVWDALVAIYEARSMMVAIDLRKRLEVLKCGENDDRRMLPSLREWTRARSRRSTATTPITSYAGAVIEAEFAPKARSELYDSGASRHMIPFRDQLINFIPIDPRPITAADKRVFHAMGKGDMRIRIPNGKTTSIILLCDVLYAPSMRLTIISIS
ncbi:hypothetical protein CPB83DRAFT_768658 [Crepidotus variabilis]|uniref:Retrovirus-related Pol polyprotein from transposon TNT 1-94-like beta-barrel domain-containing protein n=1 Tax=Crepidotus variabilis TaxID=179855 RepID=A0A9P6JP52_9AGAR|nr:hypothetical protein CPB83DRAFT_768658 [Crepidotus variabilis]